MPYLCFFYYKCPSFQKSKLLFPAGGGMFDTYLPTRYTTISRKDKERASHGNIYSNHHPGTWSRSLGRSYSTGTRTIGTGSIKQHDGLLSHAHTSYCGTPPTGNTQPSYSILRLFLR